MLRNCHLILLGMGMALFLAHPAGANDHFFPRLKALFVGLDENTVPARSRTALAQAKADFQLARSGNQPLFAHPTGTLPYTHSRTYQGNGYVLTLVNKSYVGRDSAGPEIVLDTSITGGKAYQYNEVDLVQD